MEKKELNGREVHAIEFLAGLDSALASYEKPLEGRLKALPGAWQKYRTAMGMVSKVLDAVYETVPEKMLRHMRMLAEHGEIVIRQRSTIRHDGVQIVSTEDMKLLINTAMEGKCAFCVEHGAQVKGCKLRKTLMRIVPPEVLNTGGRCNYADVAAKNNLGEYI